MSAMELVTLMTSSGVFSGGLAALTWVVRTELRLKTLEIKAKIA